MSMICGRHLTNPEKIYGQCIGCELERLQKTIKSQSDFIKTLVKSFEDVKWDADKAEFISLDGANNFKKFISDKVSNTLESGKESINWK